MQHILLIGSITMLKLVYRLLLVTAMLVTLSGSAYCMPRDHDAKQFAREKVQIAEFGEKKDISGLMQLLHSTEFKSSELAAYWLGRLGVEEALPELDKLHEQNRYHICPSPSGVFGASAARIRVVGIPVYDQVTRLLSLAADTQTDHVLASEIGQILLDYDDPRILPALKQIRTYGAQETALRLEIRDMAASQRMGFLVETLAKHATPQSGEAAQKLLIEAGASGADAVMKLVHDQSLKTNPLVETVKNRSYQIVLAVGTKAQKDDLKAAGWDWGRSVVPVAVPKRKVDVKRMNNAIKKLSNADYLVRFNAAMELREMPLDGRAITALKRATADDELIVERASLEALSRIDSVRVIPIMEDALRNDRREFRYLAAETLWKRGVKRGVRVFIDDLRSEDVQIRKRADILLERLTGMKTDYWYGDPLDEREKNIECWETWLNAQVK